MPASTADMMTFRSNVKRADIAAIHAVAAATGFFNDEETRIAVELAEDAAAHGIESDYQFILAEAEGEGGASVSRVIGFASFGKIDGTAASWDLYWIVVHPDEQSRGLGRTLMRMAEERMAEQGGRRVYVETSSRAQYEPTRRFYERCGYRLEATLADFYAPGDGKQILVKEVTQP